MPVTGDLSASAFVARSEGELGEPIEEQVEAVIGTLRQLLTEKLAVQRAADPARPTTFRLASAPPPAES